MTPVPAFLLVSRLLVSGAFLSEIARGAINPLVGPGAAPQGVDILFYSLLLLITVWLALGICARIVAMLGIALLAGHWLLEMPLTDSPIAGLTLIAALVLAAPVVIWGGGALSLYRGDWSKIL